MEYQQIFSACIQANQTKLDIDSLTSFCYEVKRRDKKGRKISNLGGWQSGNIKKNPHPEFVKLLSEIQIAANAYHNKLQFKKEYEHVYKTWEKGDLEREWVPWDWCETVKKHTKNNSIIMFTPSHKTLHAVRMDYPHTRFQRTQIYGNLMYPGRSVKKYRKNKHHDLENK